MSQPAFDYLADVPAAHPKQGEGVDAHREARVRKLKLAFGTAILTRPLSFITPLICLPLFIQYLGAERYGLYESVGALTVWLTLTNAGLSLGLLNRLQDTSVSGDRILARRYVSSLSFALMAIAVLGILLLSIVTPLVNWQAVFPTQNPSPAQGRETAWGVWAAGVITLIGVVGSIPAVVYVAYQETHVNNLWEGAARLVTLVACVAVCWTNFGLTGVIVAASGFALLTRLVNGIWLFWREKPWIRPSFQLFDWSTLRGTITEGIYLFILQIATGLIFQVDKLIIGNRISVGAVTGYAVIGRVFLIGYSVFILLQGPLWPAYGEAIRRKDYAWAHRTLKWMLLLGVGSTCGCGAIFLAFRRPIIQLLTHNHDVEISSHLIIAMTSFFALRAWAECQSVPLNSAGIVKPQLAILLANGVLNVLFALVLVKPYGVLGVAWSFPLSAALTSLWGYPLLVRRYLSVNRNQGTV